MLPTLRPGQGLVGLRTDRVRVGQLRVFEHPTTPGFWMVKRVESTAGDTMTVLSDNRDAATVDSRQLGRIPVAGSFRVVMRVPLRLM